MIQARYGVAFTFNAPIPKVGVTALAATADWTPAAGDVKVSKDQGSVVNTTTLPTAVAGTGSVLWKWTLTAAEMQAKEIAIQVVDAAVENQVLVIQTTDHPLAQHPNGITEAGTAQAGAVGSITLRSGASATNDLYQGQLCTIIAGTGAGQSKPITSYNGTTKVASISGAWATTPSATSVYELKGDAITEITVPSAVDNANAAADLDISGKTVTNTWGKKVNDTLADTADIQPKMGTFAAGSIANSLPSSLTVGGRLRCAIEVVNGRLIVGIGLSPSDEWRDGGAEV